MAYTSSGSLSSSNSDSESKDKSNEVEPESVRKNSDALIIEDWVMKKKSHANKKVKTVWVKKVNTTKPKAAVNDAKAKAKYNFVKGKRSDAVKASACWGNPHEHLQDKGVIDSGCSRHMIGNMSFLTDYEEIDGGYVAFGGNPKGGKITSKGKIKTGKLDFKNVYFLIDEIQILLRIPRQNNMYIIDLKNIVPTKDLTCLFAKATEDEFKLWHRRLGHLNFKAINKLVNGNLVRGLPFKIFSNDQSCIACQKGKQYRASCKTKVKNSISTPLHLFHMDLFGPTFVKSLNKKMYFLVVTDDYDRFTWVFFLGTKDETSGTLKSFITRVENLMNLMVKVIRCDNGTEFKSKEMNQFCKVKGIMRQVLVTKRHIKTPYELFHGRTPSISFIRPFGCPVTILNTIDHLGKFDGKANEGFFVGYLFNSKAFRVFNSRTMIVKENLHVRFSENTPNNVGSRPNWLFDIDALTKIMNYQPVVAQSNDFSGTQASNGAGKEKEPDRDYILLPLWTPDSTLSTTSKSYAGNEFQPSNNDTKRVEEDLSKENECNDQGEEDSTNSTNRVNIVTSNINAASSSGLNDVGTNISIDLPSDPNMPSLEDIGIFEESHDDEDVFGAEADFHNLDSTFQTTVKIKTINDDVRLQALIDGKKVVITEASIRHNLKLNDVEGIYVNPSLTKKVFANLKRVGTWFFGAVTPLFSTMMVQAIEEVGDLPTAVQDIPIPDASSSSQPHRITKPKRKERKETEVSPIEIHIKDHVPTTSNDPLHSGEEIAHINADAEVNLENVYNLDMAHEETVLSMHDVTDADVKEVAKEMIEVITIAKIIVDEVSTAGGKLNAANEEPVNAAPTNITTAQPSEATKTTIDITTAPKAKWIVLMIRRSQQQKQFLQNQRLKIKAKPKAEWNADMKVNIDWNKVVEQKKDDDILENMAGFKMDFFKGMIYKEIRPLFKEEYNKVQTLFKEGPEIDIERIKAPRKRKVEKDQTAKKQKGHEVKQDNAEKQKLEEQHEAEELKKNLEIVPDDEDDVFVNVTPLSFKPLTIVDYNIYKEEKNEHF
nr:hypothetical protein [Tanacetum cinerariifolium]